MKLEATRLEGRFGRRRVEPGRRPSSMRRRLIQLQIGLILYGVSLALMVRAELGLAPWSVFHQGLAERTGLSLGTIVILVGALVLLVWIPLRQRPGIGTVCNVLVIGVITDLSLMWLPHVDGLALRAGLLVLGIVLNSAAAAAYIGAGLGPGPRDGITTGLVKVTGWQVRWVRMGVEGVLLALGWMLGGTVGIGTVLYALLNGPLLHALMPRFRLAQAADVAPAAPPASTRGESPPAADKPSQEGGR